MWARTQQAHQLQLCVGFLMSGGDERSVKLSSCAVSPRDTAVRPTAPSVNGTMYRSAAAAGLFMVSALNILLILPRVAVGV